MHTTNYKDIRKIEFNATSKLLDYMTSIIDGESSLEEIEFFYPDFDEAKNRLAFNIWLSTDFITDNGQTFIEKFLNTRPSNLTLEEEEVLIGRSQSNISLFEITDVTSRSIEVYDLLQNKSYTLIECELQTLINTNDIIFGRIGPLLDNFTFIGDLSYLPIGAKSMFIHQIIIDLNQMRLDLPHLTIEEYLKTHSLNLYAIYTNCMFQAMDMEGDITSDLYDELDEFEAYLGLNTSGATIRKDITILMDFFEYYLADENLTLYDLDKIDFDLFFKQAIKEGFISSPEDLHSYISTLKKYIKFLSNINPDYRDSYKNILDISQSRFKYIKEFKQAKFTFKINRDFSNLVSNIINEEAIRLLINLDKFILYIIDNPLDLTATNKYIKRKNLFEIINILETDEFPRKKAPNQEDFPIIHLFFKLTKSLGISSIEKNKLHIAEKGIKYLRLKDEEKYTLIFQYIWRKDLVDIISSFSKMRDHDISNILPSFSGKMEFLFEYNIYLQYLGIIKCNLYPNYEVKLSPLGQSILQFLEEKDKNSPASSIISLNNFKKSP